MTTEQKLREALEILEQMDEAGCPAIIRGQIAMARTRVADALTQPPAPEQQAPQGWTPATSTGTGADDMRRAGYPDYSGHSFSPPPPFPPRPTAAPEAGKPETERARSFDKE